MAKDRQTYSSSLIPTEATTVPTFLAAADSSVQKKFEIYSYALNKKPEKDTPEEHVNKGGIQDENGNRFSFPGNINPEGYFYLPFHEVILKELDDETHFVNTKRINFNPTDGSSVIQSSVTFYNPEIGTLDKRDVSVIKIKSPVSYDFLIGQSFCIYDIMNDMSYRGYLDAFNEDNDGCLLTIVTENAIDEDILSGKNLNEKSGYIISLLEENAPEYAEFIPSSQKMIWRGPKKMSDLSSESPIYNMPFTNGRLYIHKNVNVFVRRQDPNNDYHLFRPVYNNPLRRFQIEGNPKLNFDYIKYITDSMINAC